jgi:anti-sigma B factor antagonist
MGESQRSESRQAPSSASRLLEIEEVNSGGAHTLYLSGALEISSCDEVEARLVALCEAGCDCITVDLSKLTFIDSSGLAAIIRAGQRCRGHKYEFRLTPGTVAVQRLFEVSGLLDILPFQEGL